MRNDATARRLRLSDGELRTVVGIDTMLSQRVERIALADVANVESVAPYARPTPRVALVVFGMAIGIALGPAAQPASAIIVAITAIAFAAVLSLLSGVGTTTQRLLRVRTAAGPSYTVSYLVEQTDDVRRLFGEERWTDDNLASPEQPLHPDERRHLDRMRIGIVLSASAMSIIALHVLAGNDAEPVFYVAIPMRILYLGTLGLAVMVAAIAWFKIAIAAMRGPRIGPRA